MDHEAAGGLSESASGEFSGFELEDIARAAKGCGLALRGGFRLEDAEQVGALAAARSIVLLGFVGAGQWPQFAASEEAADGRPHPLDQWSRRVVTALGEMFGATPLFPFDGPPYWPFQAWARRAEPVFASPLGLLIHPDYGLSHSYRGALVFTQTIAFARANQTLSPCATCATKACLSACPVEAFTKAGYAVDRCAGWLKAPEGGDCLQAGCQARRACPIGREYAPSPKQTEFHMRAFLAARSPNDVSEQV